MPTAQDHMVDWCKEQQVLLLRLADQLETGATVIAEKQADGQLVDNSPKSLAHIRVSLTSLERILAELAPPTSS